MVASERTGQLALDVLRQQATAFTEQAPGARAGEDPRHVHQMRVATRRMRAALRLFGNVLPAEAASLNAELKWIAGQLGGVRDLDVQIRRVHDAALELGLSQAIAPYAAWLEAQRQRANTALVDALDSQRFDNIVERFHEFDTWTPASDMPLVDDAPRRIRNVRSALRKRAKKLDRDAPAVDFHQVRIRAKRVRYAAEFFVPLYGKPAEELAERATTLQDLLGNLQDGVVGIQRIQDAVKTAAEAWPAETYLALGRMIQFETQRNYEIRTAFPAAYSEFNKKGWLPLRRRL